MNIGVMSADRKKGGWLLQHLEAASMTLESSDYVKQWRDHNLLSLGECDSVTL